MAKNKLPAGMTQNMMFIIQIETAARAQGMHYGAYTGAHDVSHLSAGRRIKQKSAFAKKCGKKIVLGHERQRHVCDTCLDLKRK